MDGLTKVLLLLYFFGIKSLSAQSLERDFSRTKIESFNVYWNIPTYICNKFGLKFEDLLKNFGIITNKGDAFRGENIIILYDPGMFPVMLENTASHQQKERNGGIPQLGNITKHLEKFSEDIEKVVPKDFQGIGVIDFESWRPVFRQNWNDQVIYRKMSLDFERQKHPQWDEKKIMAQAKVNFEGAAKVFMEETLKLAKILRPKAVWGYYGFPYCLNYGKGGSFSCPDIVKKENDGIPWLFKESTALYPSLYSSEKLGTDKLKLFVKGRMNEAWRVVSQVSGNDIIRVYPYIWYRYNDSPNFLSAEDMYAVLETTMQYKMGGALIWGSSRDLETHEKCLALHNYVKDVLGPAVQKVKQNSKATKNGKFHGMMV